jgi:hypothetical protein
MTTKKASKLEKIRSINYKEIPNPYYVKKTDFYIKTIRAVLPLCMLLIFIQMFMNGFNTSFIPVSAMIFSGYYFTGKLRENKIFIGFSMLPYYLILLPILYSLFIYSTTYMDKNTASMMSHTMIIFLIPIFYSFFGIIMKQIDFDIGIEALKKAVDMLNVNHYILMDFKKDVFYTQLKDWSFSTDGHLLYSDYSIGPHVADIISKRDKYENAIGKPINEFYSDDFLFAEMYLFK